jgi:hypothetical protein
MLLLMVRIILFIPGSTTYQCDVSSVIDDNTSSISSRCESCYIVNKTSLQTSKGVPMLWSTTPHQNHQDVSSVIWSTKQENQDAFLYFGYLGLFYLSICFGPNIIVRLGFSLFQMEKRSKKEENEPLKKEL